MKPRRFYSVFAPGRHTLHRADTLTEGNKTWCGITMRLGWKWRGFALSKHTPFIRCARCNR